MPMSSVATHHACVVTQCIALAPHLWELVRKSQACLANKQICWPCTHSIMPCLCAKEVHEALVRFPLSSGTGLGIHHLTLTILSHEHRITEHEE